MNKNIKNWYMAAFPSDDLGAEINENATFNDIIHALLAHKDVYTVFGVGDSLVRERIFEELAGLLNVDYDVIYDSWLETV